MSAATLLCTNAFIYGHQSVIHGRQEYSSAFSQNAKWSETSGRLGLKPKVTKRMHLERHSLYDIGRRRPVFTTRSGGGGGGGVDSIFERYDKLRKLTQAILWTVEGVYVLWLFLLPYAPGDPVWAISSETVNDLVGLSLNFFFILPLLNAARCTKAPAMRRLRGRARPQESISRGHPLDRGTSASSRLFNFVISWTVMYSSLLFSDRMRDRFKGSLELLWGFQMFLTNTFLIPYMAIRLNNTNSDYPPRAISKLGSAMTRGASIVGLVSGAVCLLSIFWAFYGRGNGDFGSISDRWEFFLSYLSSERLAYAFIWDICLYSIFQPWLIGDNLQNIHEDKVDIVRYLRYVPVVGLVAYCLSLDLEDEY